MKKLFYIFLTITFLITFLSACNLSETTLPTIEIFNPDDFDPNNPEGWVAESSDAWWDWAAEEELLLSADDYSFGEFSLIMPFEQAAAHFPSDPISVAEEDRKFLIEKVVTFDALKIVFWSIDNGAFHLHSVTVTDSTLATPRGLRVGDDAETVAALYGVPAFVSENVWTFGDENFFHLFHVTVVDGIVEQIHLHGVM